MSPGISVAPGAVDDPAVPARQAAAALHLDDALALDQHVTGERRRSAAIEDLRVDDECPVHGCPPRGATIARSEVEAGWRLGYRDVARRTSFKGAAMANSAGYHESESKLRPETLDNHRALTSMQEELEAADWYDQRVDAATDQDLKDILAHNRDEEKEHFAMLLEWYRRRDAKMDAHLKEYLFTSGSLIALEQAGAGGGEAARATGAGGGSLGIGSLKGGQSL